MNNSTFRIPHSEFLEHDRRSSLRREIDRSHDRFLVRLILTAAVCVAIGIFTGIQMEKRNAENIRSVSGLSSPVSRLSSQEEAK